MKKENIEMIKQAITDGRYKINIENGYVYSSVRNKDMPLRTLTKAGYVQVSICGKSFLLHDVIGIAAGWNLEGALEINHIDGDKTNCRISNLELCTHRHNLIHALKTGLRKPTAGEKNHLSKLTEDEVIEIRNLYKEGIRQKDLADKFNVDRMTIYHCVKRNTWRHVE